MLGAAAHTALAASAFVASAADAGVTFFASSDLAASLLSSFSSETALSFLPSAAVGKLALIVVEIRCTLFLYLETLLLIVNYCDD